MDEERLEEIRAIEEAMYSRPVEESPDFLIAKEEVRRYFARIMEDDEAAEKARKRKARLEKKRDAEREVAFDIQAICAAEQLKAIEPIAQAIKFKNQNHSRGIKLALQVIWYCLFIEKGEASEVCVPLQGKEYARLYTLEADTALRNNLAEEICSDIDGLCQNVACARILEAYTGSPHLYDYIASASSEGKSDRTLYDLDGVTDIAIFFPEDYIPREQVEKIIGSILLLEAFQGEEAKKVCRKIAKTIDPFELRAGEDIMRIADKNEDAITRAAAKTILKGGEND